MMVIEVKRTRQSVTQGMVEIWINGKKIIAFGDTIELVSSEQKYYGEKCGGWASVTPDSSFIWGLFYHPYDHIYHHSELARKSILKAAVH